MARTACSDKPVAFERDQYFKAILAAQIMADAAPATY
jgi:hypothetical protein